jgi:hypothetical protein
VKPGETLGKLVILSSGKEEAGHKRRRGMWPGEIEKLKDSSLYAANEKRFEQAQLSGEIWIRGNIDKDFEEPNSKMDMKRS